MLITQPYLVLTFTEDSSTATTTAIQLDSISVIEQLLNEDLSSSSNTVQFNIVPDALEQNNSSLIDDILGTDRDIKAVLWDGDPEESGSTKLFTGYLSDSFTWAVNMSGADVFQVNLEDVGSRVLNKAWSSDEDVMIRMSFENLVGEIRTKAGSSFSVIWDSSVPASKKSLILINRFEGSKTIQKIMDEVCLELGLVYCFNADGNMVIRTMDITSNASYDIYSTGNHPYLLYVENGNAISLTRKARQYSQAKVKYDTLEDSVDPIDIFSAEMDGIPAGHWWDGADHSESIYEQTLDNFFQSGKTYYTESGGVYSPATVTVGDPIVGTYYEYAGTMSLVDMVDLQKGKDIIYAYPTEIYPNLQNQTTSYIYHQGQADEKEMVTAPTGFQNSKWTIRKHGDSGKLEVLIDNTQSAISVYYTKFRAIGRIIRKLSQASVIKAAEGLVSNSDVTFTHEAQWIHDRNSANVLADLLNKWYLYCGMTYTFYSRDSFPLGSMVTIDENLHTDIMDKLLLTARSFTMYGNHEGLYKYTARAIAPFNLKTHTTSDASTPQIYVPEVRVDLDPFALSVTTDKAEVICNKRSISSQTIRITVTTTGQVGNVNVSVIRSDDPTNPYIPSPVSGQTNVWDVTIPYAFTASDDACFIITAVSTDLTVKATLPIKDNTEYNHFFGAVAHKEDITAIKLEGDYCLDKSDGQTWRYDGTQWVVMDVTDATKAQYFLTALESATREGVHLETLNNPNTVSWFNTIIAAKAVIDSLFSRYITILNGGAIHSDTYTDAGVYQGPGAGFWLGSNGELKCETADINNANAVDINISGNSSFHGSFDCSIIKTTPEDPSTYITLSPVGADGAQCKRIVDRLLNNGLIPDWAVSAQTTGLIPISVVGVSDIAFMKVTYQKGTRSGTTTYYARVEFYNSSRTELNVRDYSVLNVSKSGSGSWTNHLYSSNLNSGDLTNIPGEYAAQAGSTDGITIRVLTGQSRLWVSLPTANEATALTSGMLFRSVNPVSTGTTGVTGYALYMKP